MTPSATLLVSILENGEDGEEELLGWVGCEICEGEDTARHVVGEKKGEERE
jgi:hypothetical protein